MLVRIWTAKYLGDMRAELFDRVMFTFIWLFAMTASYLIYAFIYMLFTGRIS